MASQHPTSNVNMTVAFKTNPRTVKTERDANLSQAARPQEVRSTTSEHTSSDTSPVQHDAKDDDGDGKDDLDEAGDALAPSAQQNKSLDNLQHQQASEQTGPKDSALTTQKSEEEEDEEGGYMLLQEARRPSISDISGTVSEASEFDVADDDDDYAAVDQLSQVSENDASIEKLDTYHLASNVHDWSQGDTEMDEDNTPLDHSALGINWDDQRTYDFEFAFPYSDHFPAPSFMSDTLAIGETRYAEDGSHEITTNTNASAQHPMFVDFDPAIGMTHVAEAMSMSNDSSRRSSPDKAEHKIKSEHGLSATAENATVSDTESEELDEEIERRRRLSLSKQKQKSAQKKRRSSHKSSISSISPSSYKVQKFKPTPRRIHAKPRMTGSGRVICLTVMDRTKMRWVNGRVAVDPVATAPSPELTRQLRSRMFQQAYCPNQDNMNLLRGSSSVPGFSHELLNRTLPNNDRFALALQNPSALQHLLSGNGGDFSNFIDDDGEPGLTIAEQHFAPQGWPDDNAIINDDFDELDMDNSYLHAGMLSSPPPEGQTDDVEASPCAKRQRTSPSAMSHGNMTDDIDENDGEVEQQRLNFSSPAPGSNHISV